MARLRTHYENLKVARDAPLEVIRAAYRALSQKYHPDRNPDDPEAARVMALLNEAYRVLSDSKLRGEHDQWIRSVEALRRQTQTNSARSAAETEQMTSPGATADASATPSSNQPGIDVELEEMWAKFKGFFGIGASRR